MKARIAACIAGKPSTHWESVLGGTDVCFARVLTLDEAARHPHNQARGTYRLYQQGEREVPRSAPAPRFLPAGTE